ncbi:hypothetical protein T08_2374 [Trichinella sp. T8]|nr:hypothetical protein T08_2374 [Trichinella sp. T8]
MSTSVSLVGAACRQSRLRVKLTFRSFISHVSLMQASDLVANTILKQRRIWLLTLTTTYLLREMKFRCPLKCAQTLNEKTFEFRLSIVELHLKIKKYRE